MTQNTGRRSLRVLRGSLFEDVTLNLKSEEEAGSAKTRGRASAGL